MAPQLRMIVVQNLWHALLHCELNLRDTVCCVAETVATDSIILIHVNRGQLHFSDSVIVGKMQSVSLFSKSTIEMIF